MPSAFDQLVKFMEIQCRNENCDLCKVKAVCVKKFDCTINKHLYGEMDEEDCYTLKRHFLVLKGKRLDQLNEDDIIVRSL